MLCHRLIIPLRVILIWWEGENRSANPARERPAVLRPPPQHRPNAALMWRLMEQHQGYVVSEGLSNQPFSLSELVDDDALQQQLLPIITQSCLICNGRVSQRDPAVELPFYGRHDRGNKDSALSSAYSCYLSSSCFPFSASP